MADNIKTGLLLESIVVKNAGVVLLNSYIPMLFERLELVKDRKFTSTANQSDAVHYLQYVVTGFSDTEESLLPLNKILCGIPLTQSVKEGVDVKPEQIELINGMLNAAISHWPTIGSSSVNGFRGNWLVRDGFLTEQEDRWELLVEKRAYDILLNQSPFAFSIIKYQWMSKPLHVTWPY
jgi:hypothetical protein